MNNELTAQEKQFLLKLSNAPYCPNAEQFDIDQMVKLAEGTYCFPDNPFETGLAHDLLGKGFFREMHRVYPPEHSYYVKVVFDPTRIAPVPITRPADFSI